MIHLFLSFRMSVRLLLCLIICAGESGGNNGQVNQIAPGSDVSLSCPSGEVHWKQPSINNTVRLNLSGTEYLLIKNFQKQNEGEYTCGNENKRLDLKPASQNDQSVLFRHSAADSLYLFCKRLLNSSLRATWFWRPPHSGQYTNIPVLNSSHFGGRLHIENNNNDFSASISTVDWSDSGRYVCEISGSSSSRTVFEVMLVRVHADPQHVNEGDEVTLHCEVSHQTPHLKLRWINNETQKNFPNPHKLMSVKIDQINWACAVFYKSELKAFIPLSLTISQPLSTTVTSPPSSPTPHYHTSDESTILQRSGRNTTDTRWTTAGNTPPPKNTARTILISICTFIFFIFILVLGAACWRTWSRKTLGEECPRCERDSVTYAEMSFRQRSERRKEGGEELPVSDSVTYAEVSFRRRADDASPDHSESVSNDPPEETETEVLYSAVNLKTNIEN